MAGKKAGTKGATKTAKSSGGKASTGLTPGERAALRETIRERKAAARGENDEKAVLAKIAEMREPDRAMAKRLHAIIRASAPTLSPKTWYGMPAYAKDDKVVCFFQSGLKFKTRYATLGFQDAARLDEGQMWPTAFALTGLTAADEARIGTLVKKAAS